jgi:sarcosine oxidase delta subunit
MAKHSELLRRNHAHNGVECPFCGERDGIEWNEQRGNSSVFACHGANGCKEQWDAAEYRLTDAELAELIIK